MIHRVYAITVNTFREAVRDRVLHGVLGVGVLFLLFTLALAELSLEESMRVVVDVGLGAISLLSVLVAVFLGSSLLYKEIERKTLYVILPRPIRRWEFLVGKHLGIVLTAWVFVATTGAFEMGVCAMIAGANVAATLALNAALVATLLVSLWRVRDGASVLVPWSAATLAVMSVFAGSSGVDVRLVLISLLLILGEVVVLAAVAILFSSFSTPFLTGLLTAGVWTVGRAAASMATLESEAVPREVRLLLRGLAEVIPNLNLFVPGRHALTHRGAELVSDWQYAAQTMTYGFCYAAIVLVLAAAIFRKRDFL